MVYSSRPQIILCLILGALICFSWILGKEEHELLSPDERIKVNIAIGESITYSVHYDNQKNIASSPLLLKTKEQGILGKNPRLIDSSSRTVKEIIRPVVPTKSKEIDDHYNELTLTFENNYQVEFRAYNDGVAYRLVSTYEGPLQIIDEEVTLNFTKDHQVYFPAEESFLTHSERLYQYLSLSQITWEQMGGLPLLIDIKDGPKIAVTEASLIDYPGLYLTGNSNFSLTSKFPSVALKERQTRDRTVEAVLRAAHIAETRAPRSFPWRILVIAEREGQLIESQIVYKLSPEPRIDDPSWIKPGKAAWDWWNNLNIYGVDFAAGINTATYKYFIDFASSHGIEYIIMDEGWSDTTDLFKVNADLNMEEILSYGSEKNVGIILWVVWKTLDDQLQPALDLFEKWGVKGIKVDFMQRDDQWMVNYCWKIAEEAAKRKLLVNFHGAYKPAGLRRAYPNVLTREGVLGLEHSKWSRQPTPEHNLTIPFIRMLAGPMDYTPGAMVNAQEKDFAPLFSTPMSLGTRCHQLAMYVVYESPLQMLADSPTRYLREKECLDFISKVPVTWDKTRVLEAAVGDYVLIARQKGDHWYAAAMTDWTPRELTLDLSFLEPGSYQAEIFRDGINAGRNGNDYKKIVTTVTSPSTIKIKLAPGGGWAARFSRLKKETSDISP
ncbi:MAG: glycoside hydrolase family 97 protein [Acidobacteriota bacterium]